MRIAGCLGDAGIAFRNSVADRVLIHPSYGRASGYGQLCWNVCVV